MLAWQVLLTGILRAQQEGHPFPSFPCCEGCAVRKGIQSRTGGVLGAVPSAAFMGARRIFSGGGRGKFRGAKKLTFLVVTLKTQVYLMHKTLNNISRGRGKCPQNISFVSKGCLCSSKGGGACAMAQCHNGQFKPGWIRYKTKGELVNCWKL